MADSCSMAPTSAGTLVNVDLDIFPRVSATLFSSVSKIEVMIMDTRGLVYVSFMESLVDLNEFDEIFRIDRGIVLKKFV
jgi:hypothetical protein